MDLDDEELEATRKLHNRKEEIKVGEYVRTEKYGIKKIDHLAINPNVTVNKYRYYLGIDKDGDRCYGTIKTTEIVKHSSNIIDLIEEDDIGIMRYNGLIFKKFITKDDILELKFKNYELLEIVTKEQFNQVKYEV